MNRNTTVLAVALFAGILAGEISFAQHPLSLPLRGDGRIPAWLVAGPFEQGIEGFGDWRPIDAIRETSIQPHEGDTLPAPLVAGGKTRWLLQSTDARGYLDLNATVGWSAPASTPEQVWWTKAAYAYAALESPVAQRLRLLAGTNSQLVVILNGAIIHTFTGHRIAVPDADTIDLPLVAGMNHLMLKIGNDHKNHRSPFFGGIEFGWGGFCRILTQAGQPPKDVAVSFAVVPTAPRVKLYPTFFFRRTGGTLQQQHVVEIFSPGVNVTACTLSTTVRGRTTHYPLPPLLLGINRLPVWQDAEDHDVPVNCRLTVGNRSVTIMDTLRAERKYELQLVFLTHTDIGYTHPQPVVKELHCLALDEVLALCRKHPDFRWTIETVWQLEQFRESRTPEVLDELYRYMREGRIALSPVSTNPYTGWVSEEEMIRALYPGSAVQQAIPITTPGAVYNDVPGLAWMLPRVLHDAGVKLVMCGLNEVYGGYTLQRSLPKAFMWEGGDGARIAVYRNETYVEGTDYGLERNNAVIAHRMWERLLRLRATGENREMVLLNAAWFDNGPPAEHQFEAARKWNEEYAYPRFVVTTLAQAAEAFLAKYGPSLPVLRGDWTSSWDMLYQGEPERVVWERATQQRLLAAEGFDALSTVVQSKIMPATPAADGAYAALLEYSGHGSGLEAGFGTPGENALTMQVREEYLREASGHATDIYYRALTRFIRPEEAFEAEGIIVMNPLSWRCTVPVELELKDSSDKQLQLTDMVTGRVVPSFRKGHRLSFVASDLPPLGFRKYATAFVAPNHMNVSSGNLRISAASIENGYYRIGFDSNTGQVTTIHDKHTSRELFSLGRAPFNEPLVETGITGRGFRRVTGAETRCIVTDERPVRCILSIQRPGELVENTDYVLWDGIDRVDVTHTVNLERLRPPDEVEVYAAGFPFAFAGQPSAYMDILGGFANTARDRLPGALKDIYSTRRSAALTDGRTSISLAAADSRILFWKHDSLTGRQILLANLVTNFPVAWNRNEANNGNLRLRFAFKGSDGPFDADGTARLGWELQAEYPARYTLVRRNPAEESLLSVAGRNIVLTELKRGIAPDDVVLRVTNVSPDSSAEATITSSWLLPASVSTSTLLETGAKQSGASGASVRSTLGPSEIRTFLFRKTK
jgi:alpha-mannosidase